MLDDNVPKTWQGQTTLVFALSAVAIGFGNLFRLPFLLGEHGGAPFFITYVATLLLVTAPVMAAEVMLGSQGRGSPVAAIRWTADQSNLSPFWSGLGVFQSVLALLLAAQLTIFAGWMLDRADMLNSGVLASASARDISENFSQLVASQDSNRIYTVGLLIASAILPGLGPQVAMGIIGWLALPAMAATCLTLLEFSLAEGDLVAGGEFLFAVKYDDFSLPGVMAGISSAVFTLGAGLGVGLCFGTRAPKNLPLLRALGATVIVDTAFALAIAICVIPLLYAVNAEPVSGIPLVFVAIPYAFANLPAGDAYGALFYGFLTFATFAAVVALMEPAVMLLRRDWGLNRILAAVVVALVLGSLTVILRGSTEFSVLTAQLIDLLIPVSMLLTAIFVGWRVARPITRGELYREPRWLFIFWWELLRLVAPAVLILTLLWLWMLPTPPQ